MGAVSHKDVAREMLGQVLPSWEPCNEINPDVERIPVTRVAPNAMVEETQQVFDEEDRAGLERLDQSENLSEIEPATPEISSSESLAPDPKLVSIILPDKQILEPKSQQGAAEKNIAKLLHQAGITSEILKGDKFYLKVENEPFTPLSIERHGKELYLTHYLADDYGDLFLDAEMVFNVSAQGQLTLTQTASQNPLTGGEYRSYDRAFGQVFSRNLLEQGFGKAAHSAFQTKQQSASVQSPALVEIENLHQTALGLEQIPVEVENLQETEAPQQLEKAAVARKADEQPLEQAPTVATVVSNPIQKVVEPSLQLPEVATKEPIKPKSSLKSSASTQVQIEAPLGVQLSLFDIGLNQTDAADLKSVPQNTAKVEKVPTLTTSNASKPNQSVKETVVTPLKEAPLINKEPESESFISSEPSTDSSALAETVDPMQLFVQVVDRVDKRTGEMLATLQSSSPSLNTLRDWYKAAKELNKSQKHLDRISEIGSEFKQGVPLTDKAVTAINLDFQTYYKQLMVVEQLSNLSDGDLVNLNQNITNYLNSPPPGSPPLADRQKVESEVKQITDYINTLGSQQSEQLATGEAMQESPFRSWNGKYDLAVAQVEQTANKLDNAIAHLQQRENQLGQWNKQEMAYSLWDKSPQTVEMRNLAKGLQSPQLQERLSSIPKNERQEFARSQVPSNRQAGLSA